MATHEEIAELLGSLQKKPVNWEDFKYVIEESEPWDPIKWPQDHDWSLIEDVPLGIFSDVSVAAIAAVEDPDERKEHRERYRHIRDLLKAGEEPWPVIVASNGMILDGYHRLAAMKTLKRKAVDVLLVQV
jgi:hypothetical protein